MFYNKVQVKAIVLAVYNIDPLGLNSKDILLNSITWLCKQYESEGDEIYLEKAMWHIYAYLELGYPYESGVETFRTVLQYLHQDMETVFPKKDWEYKKIALTKANVNQLLGKWNPYFQSMKIDAAILDIIEKVREKKYGEFTYHCGRIIEEDEEKTLWEKTFILRIGESGSILQDLNKNRYYVLDEV